MNREDAECAELKEKMTVLRKAAGQALEALHDPWDLKFVLKAMTDLSAALIDSPAPDENVELIEYYYEEKINRKEPQPGIVNIDEFNGFCYHDGDRGTFIGDMKMLKWLVENRAADYFRREQ